MEEALKALDTVLQSYHHIGIAFSGGVDSTFLVRAALELYGPKSVTAFTVKSPYIPQWEVDEALALTKALGIRHEVISLGVPEVVRNNPEDRCYQCKHIVFSEILKASRSAGCDVLCDGTNFDDTKDYRPGLRALDELGVVSPLKAAKLTKAEIRAASKSLHLETWDKPPYACLLTRMPYGMIVTDANLRQIEMGEKLLMEKGFRGVRLRHHGEIARIEIAREEMHHALNLELFEEVTVGIKALGFSFVTLDLSGYQSGCYNAGLVDGEAKNESGDN